VFGFGSSCRRASGRSTPTAVRLGGWGRLYGREAESPFADQLDIIHLFLPINLVTNQEENLTRGTSARRSSRMIERFGLAGYCERREPRKVKKGEVLHRITIRWHHLRTDVVVLTCWGLIKREALGYTHKRPPSLQPQYFTYLRDHLLFGRNADLHNDYKQ
jgi:hypothetical protein